MFIFTRKPSQSLSIHPHPTLDPGTPVEQLFVGGPIQVQVLGVQGAQVRLGVAASAGFCILRDELLPRAPPPLSEGARRMLARKMGGAYFDGTPFKVFSRDTFSQSPIIDYNDRGTGDPTDDTPIFGAPITVSGNRFVDARASYGISLSTFALGFPVHFDWSWKTLMNKNWEDIVFAQSGGSEAFRKVKFSLWIGYDW